MSYKNNNQSGNILFLILLAVALFATLTYALSTSSRTTGTGAGSENALIASSDLTQYAAAVANAITILKVSNRCADNEISFERSPFDGSDTAYVNSNARADFSCHVFHANGGHAASRPPPKSANDGTDWTYAEIVVMGIGADQTDCGANCSDLALVLGGLHRATCEKINEKVTGNITIPVQDDGADYEQSEFNGQYQGTRDIDGDATGQLTLCVQSSDDEYYYYHVLLPR